MKLNVIGLVLLVLLFSFVVAENNTSGNWDDFSDGNDTEIVVAEEVNDSIPSNNTHNPDEAYNFPPFDNSGETSNYVYTEDFFLAFWVSIGAIFLLILFFYLFFRRPHNSWKR